MANGLHFCPQESTVDSATRLFKIWCDLKEDFMRPLVLILDAKYGFLLRDPSTGEIMMEFCQPVRELIDRVNGKSLSQDLFDDDFPLLNTRDVIENRVRTIGQETEESQITSSLDVFRRVVGQIPLESNRFRILGDQRLKMRTFCQSDAEGLAESNGRREVAFLIFAPGREILKPGWVLSDLVYFCTSNNPFHWSIWTKMTATRYTTEKKLRPDTIGTSWYYGRSRFVVTTANDKVQTALRMLISPKVQLMEIFRRIVALGHSFYSNGEHFRKSPLAITQFMSLEILISLFKEKRKVIHSDIKAKGEEYFRVLTSFRASSIGIGIDNSTAISTLDAPRQSSATKRIYDYVQFTVSRGNPIEPGLLFNTLQSDVAARFNAERINLEHPRSLSQQEMRAIQWRVLEEVIEAFMIFECGHGGFDQKVMSAISRPPISYHDYKDCQRLPSVQYSFPLRERNPIPVDAPVAGEIRRKVELVTSSMERIGQVMDRVRQQIDVITYPLEPHEFAPRYTPSLYTSNGQLQGRRFHQQQFFF